MNPSLARLNSLPTTDACEALRGCCGAERWLRKMEIIRPFPSEAEVHATADRVFGELQPEDWLAAFACHPQIGDLDSLRMRFAGNKEWSHGEQRGVDTADDGTLTLLAAGNVAYLRRFGYIFIVCASGKSAAEMLTILEARLPNSPETELPIAAAEQRKITHLRIDKLLDSLASQTS